eukprot:COSAG04_NODE_5029_length_1775_cov_1.558473_2_plen_101_part_00
MGHCSELRPRLVLVAQARAVMVSGRRPPPPLPSLARGGATGTTENPVHRSAFDGDGEAPARPSLGVLPQSDEPSLLALLPWLLRARDKGRARSRLVSSTK